MVLPKLYTIWAKVSTKDQTTKYTDHNQFILNLYTNFFRKPIVYQFSVKLFSYKARGNIIPVPCHEGLKAEWK
jgi:hypothetical protein